MTMLLQVQTRRSRLPGMTCNAGFLCIDAKHTAFAAHSHLADSKDASLASAPAGTQRHTLAPGSRRGGQCSDAS